MATVIVVVSGGVVQSAYSNDDVSVEVLDLDDLESDGGNPDEAIDKLASEFDPIY